MRVVTISRHFGDGTSEGLCAVKAAMALSLCGHRTEIVAAAGSDDLEALIAGAGALPVTRIGPRPEEVPALFRTLERHLGTGLLRSRLAAPFRLLHGHSVAEAAWIRPAAREARRLVEAEDGTVLFTRLNPAASHFAGLEVARSTGVAWCAAFSDPWPLHLYPEPYRFSVGPVARRRLETFLDRFLERSDALVFPSSRLRDFMLCGRRDRHRSKSFVVPHVGALGLGGEEEGTRTQRSAALRFRHAGFLMAERDLSALVEGVDRWLHRHPDAADEVRFEFVGRYGPAGPPTIPARLDALFSFEPAVGPLDAARWICGADVLLLVEAPVAEGIFFPSKLADYAAVGKPILALSPSRGVAADLLREAGRSTVPPDDAAAIAEAVECHWKLWRAGELEDLVPEPSLRRRVSPTAVAGALVEALEHAVAGRRRRESGDLG